MKFTPLVFIVVIISSLLGTVTAAQADTGINGGQALDLCKNTIRERTAGTHYHKFRRDHTTSTRGGDYTFKINSVMKNDERKYLLRSRCVVTKTGDIETLEIEEGRW